MHSKSGVIQEHPSGAMHEGISFLAECDPVYLAERQELGAINFQRGKSLFRRAAELGREIQGLSLESLPDGTRLQLFEALDELALTLIRIAKFSPEGLADPEEERDMLLDEAHAQYDRAFTLIAPYLAYLYLKNLESQDTTRKSTEQLQDSLGQVTERLQEVSKRLTELDRTIKATNVTAGNPVAPRQTDMRLPTVYGFTSNEITNQWTVVFIMAPIVIGFAIWLGLQIFHWGAP